MPEIVIGGLVVPGVVAAAVAALWSFATQRSLRALEGRLGREAEAFRLAQSPRVRSAVAFWAAYAAFERAVGDLVAPYEPFEDPDGDGDDRRAAFLAHEETARRAVRRAHARLVVARAEAECLLPRSTFAAVDALVRSTAEACDRYYAARTNADLAPSERKVAREKALAVFEETRARREGAADALRHMIADPLGS